jgi:hypothetical protein
MSLVKTSMLDIVKKQFRYKLKAYKQVFMSLIFIQLLAVFFSFNGVCMMGDGQDLEKESIGLYDAAIEGNIEKIDKKFINKVWSFGYEG